MKGVIFTELVRFMEETVSPEFADKVLVNADLPNNGAFTSVGNYPTAHAAKMIEAAVELSGIDASELSRQFGRTLFSRFIILFPEILSRYKNASELLDNVGPHIHTEVCTLYPDAQPPQVSTEKKGDRLIVRYSSHRPMAAIAFGLIEQCLIHYGDNREVSWERDAPAFSASFIIAPPSAAAA
ncbi:MAG: heme NO-binding domain-containing protein [Parasphingorhabdus sp.]|uniref:heme NO-binding domain-containing protein n=1 Tax=Parasphingorhabdus sp. TaxID=2709688 RepID=UPI003266E5C9